MINRRYIIDAFISLVISAWSGIRYWPINYDKKYCKEANYLVNLVLPKPKLKTYGNSDKKIIKFRYFKNGY